jgi:hypothetical protein
VPTGTMEVAQGKITRNQDKVEQGRERKVCIIPLLANFQLLIQSSYCRLGSMTTTLVRTTKRASSRNVLKW